MDVALDATARDWRDRAFKFATEELIPWEVEAELHEGRLPPEVEKRHKKLAIELGFSAHGRAEIARRPRGAHRRPGRGLGTARARHERALLVLLRGAGLDVRGLHRRADPALHPAAHERRAERVLRDHRERLRLGRIGRDDRAAREGRIPRSTARSGTSRARTTRTISSCRRGSRMARTRAPTRSSSSTRRRPASRSSARRSSATRSARTTRPTASRTSSCRRASGSAPRATACASRMPGSGASGS